MAIIRWTLQAADDLEAITDFIAQDSRHYANLLAMEVLNKVERLEAFPDSGRIVPEIGDPKIRELLYGSYRIIYRVSEESVEILTVYHSARILNLSRIT